MGDKSDNNGFSTPETSKKRTIDETVSPTDCPAGEHVNAPEAVRRKESFSPLAANSEMQCITHDLTDLVKSAICSPEVMEAICAAVVPNLSVMFTTMLKPLNDKMDAQNKTLSTMSDKLLSQNNEIKQLKAQNTKLRSALADADQDIDALECRLDDMEQYSRRTSLRFHNVSVKYKPIRDSNTQTISESTSNATGSIQTSDSIQQKNDSSNSINHLDYDKIVVDLCNNVMNVNPPITEADIERSHPIGAARNGHFQLLCKFKDWKLKNRVFQHKKNFKTHRSDVFKVFVTEDLTRKRQMLVKQLEAARKDKMIDSHWTYDGRILFKRTSNSKVSQVRHIKDLNDILTELSTGSDNPWNNQNSSEASSDALLNPWKK
ncbi:uncharacterized protein LOC128557409 [Mercenaria mercenaria]|uniref:uncharacterized protein LOC128557409 n=1 Tax=Mercenaria mercenaria TaxID=6596 RepID=UPI00234F8F22|nr:uncharacterized protein LOC128557409 [Mercenaria mercenaria]